MHALLSFVLMLLICAILSGVIIMATFWGYNSQAIDIEKTSIYECGFSPYQAARHPLEIKFYLVSLLFIIFDIEVLFLFPLSLSNVFMSNYVTILLIFFTTFVILGIVYEMRFRALDYSTIKNKLKTKHEKLS